MMKSISMQITLAILLLLSHNCGKYEAKPKITFSHILSDQSEWHVGAAKWKELVEEKLGDQLSIRLVTNSSLSKNNQRTELEMVQAGTLGGSWESSILLTIIDPRWTVWSLPWLFDSYEEASKIFDSELGKEMLASLEDKGIIGLAYGFNGFRRLTNNTRPVATIHDIEGLKIRVPAIQMYTALFRLWGADPSQMNFGDLIVALREGAMDGQENPLHVIRSSGLYELQKHLTHWEYSFDPIIFCISKQVWDKLTPEQQNVIRKAAEEASAFQRETVIQNEKKHLDFSKENGVDITIPHPSAIAEFKKASVPIYEEYEKEIGASLLKRFLKETEYEK